MTTITEEAPPTEDEAPDRALKWRLFGLSFLMLFLELALIRWAGSNNVHLTYLTNFILLSSFLGIGIGFLRVHSGPDLFRWTPVALAAFVGFVLAFPVNLTDLSGKEPLQGAFGMAALPRWVSLGIMFVLTVSVMACVGHGVARTFVRFPALEAYRFDILGSLAGIVVFATFSFLQLPPIAWGLTATILLIALLGWRPQVVLLAAVVVLLLIESLAPNDHWSPYYKVTAKFHKTATVSGLSTHGVLRISANNIPHQTAYPVATLKQNQPFYFFPYRHLPAGGPGRVLIVGAGSGNDVAVALSEGATHVDAVEIDPTIRALGKKYHADKPYSDPRVTVHINDGRAFIQQDHRKYNLILFALPDSLTLLSGQGSLRLENYLFTKESMKTVKKHLAPGGTFAMYNYYESYLLDRYASTLQDVYGRAPCEEVGDALAARKQAVLTSGAGATVNCQTAWVGAHVSAPTDDYPFPYLAQRRIPAFYWHTLLLMLIAALILIRFAGGKFRGMATYLDLAFMGAAFLLLETKNVVQFALLFGTTWFVNALVFGGVLLSVYLAIEVARHVKLPRPQVLYPLLLLSLVVAWLVPQETLLNLSSVPRAACAILLAFAPIFLANLVFAQRFRESASATTAFAANLLGALIGGALEYTALITGYRFLLVVVGVLYLIAFLTTPRKQRALT
jgi:Spermine/spermidine synthase domain